MNIENRIYKLLSQLIENPCEWDVFFKDFSNFLKIDGIAFNKIYKEQPRAELLLPFNLDPKFVKNYENFLKKERSILNYFRNFDENKLLDDRDLLEDLNDFEVHNNFLRENNFHHIAILGIHNNLKENLIFISLRKKENSIFKKDEKIILKKFSNPFNIILSYCSKLENMENYIELLKKTLEFEGKGIILLDKNLKIKLINKIAEEILSTKDGIEISTNGLEIMDPVASINFNKNIKRILFSNNNLNEDYIFAVPKKDKGIPMIIQMLPVQEKCILNENSKKIILVIYDPRFEPLPSPSFLSNTFQFTAQENNIALFLSKGMDLKEIARELKISLHTVRTHLKHIYAKTNTSRQAELMKLLLGLPHNI